ncbi:hypothetical protein R3P38DRAFT_2808244 [Favolaschia claudopus]|uniref:Uncharacterized protein n=1 Tax=Favolaschia claudopus TaxID=2862362 RepID=A0AAV9ZGW1_9AGAR
MCDELLQSTKAPQGLRSGLRNPLPDQTSVSVRKQRQAGCAAKDKGSGSIPAKVTKIYSRFCEVKKATEAITEPLSIPKITPISPTVTSVRTEKANLAPRGAGKRLRRVIAEPPPNLKITPISRKIESICIDCVLIA